VPVYDYKCKKCSKVFEVEHKIGDMKMKFCPSCGGDLKRAYNAVGVVFKGSGFHSTDYGKKEKKSEPKKQKSSEPKSSKS
jgi:putative FmdB family regulatory protein